MLKMVDGTGIIGVDMICPLGVSTPQPPNYDRVELEGTGMLVLPNSLDAPLERLELIGNSVQGENPALDNPQEIKSCGRKSKNLFDAKKAKSGWITTDGKQTLVTLGSTDNVVSDYIQVYPGMKYTSSARVFQNFYDSEKNFLNHNTTPSTSIVVPDNAKYMIVVIAVNKALAIQTANTLMINIGSSALPYEQYTDKYLLDVKVTGKNLLNLQKASEKVNWTQHSNFPGYYNFPVFVGRGNTVTISIPQKIPTGQGLFLSVCLTESGAREGWIAHNSNDSLNNTKLTYKATNDYIYLNAHSDTIAGMKKYFGNLQVEYGNVATPYQPYKEQTLTLTSDRPITKWDRLVEQGGQIGWLYGSYVGKMPKTGYSISYKNDGKNYYFRQVLTTPICDFAKQHFNCFKNGDASSENGIDVANIKVDRNRLQIALADTSVDSIQEFESYLQNLGELEFLYRTSETEFIPLPQSEQNAIRALRTYYPTTVITADGGELDPDIKVTYRKEI